VVPARNRNISCHFHELHNSMEATEINSTGATEGNSVAATERKDLLKSVLPSSPHLNAVVDHVVDAEQVQKPPDASPQLITQAALANSVAYLTNNNKPLVQEVVDRPDINTLRDVAFHLGPEKTHELTNSSSASDGSPFDVHGFQKLLFQAEPTAVVHRMVDENKVSFGDFF
jgi:hypothetical protein